MEFFTTLNHWTWWVLAVILIAIEIIAPTTVLLWMGLSAITVGLVLLVVPDMSWAIQLLIFSALSFASVIVWKRVARKSDAITDQPLLNKRLEQYHGRVFTLEQAIKNGVGQIRIDDTIWRVIGPDLPEGSRVRVVGEESMSFIVEAVEN